MDTDRLEQIAQELVCRVRDEGPIDNGRWLQAVTSTDDRWCLLFILAAAIPLDVPWRHLTAWTLGTGGPDTPESIADRRAALNSALEGADPRKPRKKTPAVAA